MHDARTPDQLIEPTIRPAETGDVDCLHRFICELAETEEHPETVSARPEDLAAALFGPDAVAEAIVATVHGEPAGFALYYPTYSTIRGRLGIHLEDLYVSPAHRGSGLGRQLLSELAALTVRRGGARLEWWVLRTNEPAIRFYGQLHARTLDEVEVQRLESAALENLATTHSTSTDNLLGP